MLKTALKFGGKIFLAGLAAVGGGIAIQGAQTEARAIGDRVEQWLDRRKTSGTDAAPPQPSPNG